MQKKNRKSHETYAIIPPNGGWGWVVVASAFYINVVIDGIQLTFGVFIDDISENLHLDVPQVAFANSLMFGMHLIMGKSIINVVRECVRELCRCSTASRERIPFRKRFLSFFFFSSSLPFAIVII